MTHQESAIRRSLAAAAGALASAIQEEPQWRAWRDAQDALGRDPDLTGLFTRFETLSERWRQVKSMRGELPGKDVMEMAQVREKIMAHPLLVRREDAEKGMLELLQEVNTSISDKLGIDFAASAAPRQGGCCG